MKNEPFIYGGEYYLPLRDILGGFGVNDIVYADGEIKIKFPTYMTKNNTEEIMLKIGDALIHYRDVYLRPEYYAEKETAAKALLSDLICEVENDTKDYDTALKEAYTKIYQSINPDYVPNEEIGIDRIYLDIPAADTVMFTQARKLLKEAQTRSVQK